MPRVLPYHITCIIRIVSRCYVLFPGVFIISITPVVLNKLRRLISTSLRYQIKHFWARIVSNSDRRLTPKITSFGRYLRIVKLWPGNPSHETLISKSMVLRMCLTRKRKMQVLEHFWLHTASLDQWSEEITTKGSHLWFISVPTTRTSNLFI